eukprot:5187534-Pyramimonas_sp.AAC.1
MPGGPLWLDPDPPTFWARNLGAGRGPGDPRAPANAIVGSPAAVFACGFLPRGPPSDSVNQL